MKIESLNNAGGKTFLTILADGKFHQEVPEGTEGAVIREYEDSKGNKGAKCELVHDSIKGKITKIEIVEKEFGKSLNLHIDDDGIISTGVASKFGEDLMKKLPNVDFEEELTLTPYSFTPKGEEHNKSGVTITQDGVKIGSYYYDAENKKSINGIPEVEGDSSKFDSDDWKIHFTVVRKFLMKEIEKLPVYGVEIKEEKKDTLDEIVEEINPEDIPF
jgi:hypothetical protein